MAEQLDVRTVLSIARRRRLRLAAIAVLGAVLGAALVTWQPPLYTSESKVLLPQRAAQADGELSSWESSTQVRIAESDAVLEPAASAMTPPLSRREVRRLVDVSAPTDEVLFIEARGRTAAAATALAQAVAESEVAYLAQSANSLSDADLAALQDRLADLQTTLDGVNAQIVQTQQRLDATGAATPDGQRDARALAELTAQQTQLVLEINKLETTIGTSVSTTTSARIIESGTEADRPTLVLWYVAACAGLALVGVLLALGVMVSRTRRDAKLGTRDEIADAVGSEVVATLRSQGPRTVAAWRSLLESYSPSVAEGWALRLALADLGLDNVGAGRSGATAGSGSLRQLCVVSLEDDPRALAIGPQVASYAASLGIATRLVPEQGEATAALWAACSSPGDAPLRDNLTVASRRRTKQPADLTVVVAALERRDPQMPRLLQTDTVVLAVSARAATSEDLARVAVLAYEAGFRIAGVLVTDADPLDRTTGRMLPHERLKQTSLPSRVGGGLTSVGRESSWGGGAS